MEFQLVYAKLVSPIAIGQNIADWAARVPSGQITQTALHALDMIPAQADLMDMQYTTVGSSYFRNGGQKNLFQQGGQVNIQVM